MSIETRVSYIFRLAPELDPPGGVDGESRVVVYHASTNEEYRDERPVTVLTLDEVNRMLAFRAAIMRAKQEV